MYNECVHVNEWFIKEGSSYSFYVSSDFLGFSVSLNRCRSQPIGSVRLFYVVFSKVLPMLNVVRYAISQTIDHVLLWILSQIEPGPQVSSPLDLSWVQKVSCSHSFDSRRDSGDLTACPTSTLVRFIDHPHPDVYRVMTPYPFLTSLPLQILRVRGSGVRYRRSFYYRFPLDRPPPSIRLFFILSLPHRSFPSV